VFRKGWSRSCLRLVIFLFMLLVVPYDMVIYYYWWLEDFWGCGGCSLRHASMMLVLLPSKRPINSMRLDRPILRIPRTFKSRSTGQTSIIKIMRPNTESNLTARNNYRSTMGLKCKFYIKWLARESWNRPLIQKMGIISSWKQLASFEKVTKCSMWQC